jgi:hypothetical protein
MTLKIKKIIAVCGALFLSSCVSVPLTPRTALSAAQQYVPVPQNISGPVNAKKARIFFITNLNPGVLGVIGQGHIRIIDGRTVIGELQSASYLCWERDPGQTTIKFAKRGDEYDHNWFVANLASYIIKAEGGQSYYLYFGGLAQRSLLTAQDAKLLLSAYPPPAVAENYGAEAVSTVAASPTLSSATQKPV